MILFNKKVAETPLQMLNRFRKENPEFSNSKLSYAGRLDPMAYGQTIILVDEENKDSEKYRGYDKEYEATFLVGFSTDTGDALGLVDDIFFENSRVEISQNDLLEKINNLKKIKKQKYPWFSAMTVNGKKLFDHYKDGNLNIDRPDLDVEIREVELIEFVEYSTEEIKKYIFDTIKLVEGDFRQKEILKKWEKVFDSESVSESIQAFTIKIKVSSGTYIRGLTESFGVPTILFKLHRTNIFID